MLLAHATAAAGDPRLGPLGDGSGHPAVPGTAAGTPSHAAGGGGGAIFGGPGAGAGGGAEPELVMRGLRCRIGLHSGPDESEVVLEVVEGALVARYIGDFLAVAKEVSDSAIVSSGCPMDVLVA